MSRKKSAKRSAKRQTMTNILATVQKLEKEFIQVPAQLANRLTKEINTHQKQESKLAKALNKASSLAKKAESRFKALVNAKSPSAANKKQVKIAKNAHNDAKQLHAELSKQLQAVTTSIEALLSKQSKLESLGKYLNQFEKEWAKAIRDAKKAAKHKAEAKANAKANAKAKTKTKKRASSKAKTETHTTEQPRFVDTDATVDHVGFDEVAELAS